MKKEIMEEFEKEFINGDGYAMDRHKDYYIAFLSSSLDKAKQEGREEGYERVLQVKSDALDTLLLIMKNACIEERERILKLIDEMLNTQEYVEEYAWKALTSLKEQITRIEK